MAEDVNIWRKMILGKLNNDCNQLIQEREVIQENLNQLSKLSEELTSISDLQKTSSDFNSYQTRLLNEKRINLRHHVVNLQDGLQVHYDLGEEIMRPLVSLLLLQTLTTQHGQILKKLADIDAVILNLSPMGILFNSAYLKHVVDSVCLVISNLSCQENSLLAVSGICRDEEAL